MVDHCGSWGECQEGKGIEMSAFSCSGLAIPSSKSDSHRHAGTVTPLPSGSVHTLHQANWYHQRRELDKLQHYNILEITLQKAVTTGFLSTLPIPPVTITDCRNGKWLASLHCFSLVGLYTLQLKRFLWGISK